jgi:hypothetical protein
LHFSVILQVAPGRLRRRSSGLRRRRLPAMRSSRGFRQPRMTSACEGSCQNSHATPRAIEHGVTWGESGAVTSGEKTRPGMIPRDRKRPHASAVRHGGGFGARKAPRGASQFFVRLNFVGGKSLLKVGRFTAQISAKMEPRTPLALPAPREPARRVVRPRRRSAAVPLPERRAARSDPD